MLSLSTEGDSDQLVAYYKDQRLPLTNPTPGAKYPQILNGEGSRPALGNNGWRAVAADVKDDRGVLIQSYNFNQAARPLTVYRAYGFSLQNGEIEGIYEDNGKYRKLVELNEEDSSGAALGQFIAGLKPEVIYASKSEEDSLYQQLMQEIKVFMQHFSDVISPATASVKSLSSGISPPAYTNQTATSNNTSKSKNPAPGPVMSNTTRSLPQSTSSAKSTSKAPSTQNAKIPTSKNSTSTPPKRTFAGSSASKIAIAYPAKKEAIASKALAVKTPNKKPGIAALLIVDPVTGVSSKARLTDLKHYSTDGATGIVNGRDQGLFGFSRSRALKDEGSKTFTSNGLDDGKLNASIPASPFLGMHEKNWIGEIDFNLSSGDVRLGGLHRSGSDSDHWM